MGANQTWAKIIGIVLLLLGVVGFFTASLFGLLSFNMPHNIVHLLTGAIFAWAGFAAAAPAKKVNTWLGVIYVLVALVGWFGYLPFLGLGTGDHVTHLVIGLISVLVGWKGD